MFPHQDLWLFRSVVVQHDIWGPACVLWTFTLIWKASWDYSKWCHHKAQGCNCRICKGGDQAEQCCSHPNNTKNVNAKIELLKISKQQGTGVCKINLPLEFINVSAFIWSNKWSWEWKTVMRVKLSVNKVSLSLWSKTGQETKIMFMLLYTCSLNFRYDCPGRDRRGNLIYSRIFKK